MPLTPAILATAAVAVTGVLAVAGAVLLRRGGGAKSKRAFKFQCPTCQASLNISAADWRPLEMFEMSLIVSVEPGAGGMDIVEYRCPNCEAAHYFSMLEKGPAYVTTNAFEPLKNTTCCIDCRRPFVRPTWPEGAYDGRVEEAPDLEDGHGLTCSRCGAACCVACVKKATRNRTEDGSFLCPRCHRGPVEAFFHF